MITIKLNISGADGGSRTFEARPLLKAVAGLAIPWRITTVAA
jgi:hypothetical protein